MSLATPTAIFMLLCGLLSLRVHADGWHSNMLEHKDPLEWWKRERETLGLPPAEEASLSEDRAAKALEIQRKDRLIFKLLSPFLSKENSPKEREHAKAELLRILAETHRRKDTGNLLDSASRKRRVFIFELISGLKYLRPEIDTLPPMG